MPKLIYDEKELTNVSDIAKGFNDFFSDNGITPSENLGNVELDTIAQVTFNPATIFLTPVTHNECSRIIKNLKCTRQGLLLTSGTADTF